MMVKQVIWRMHKPWSWGLLTTVLMPLTMLLWALNEGSCAPGRMTIWMEQRVNEGCCVWKCMVQWATWPLHYTPSILSLTAHSPSPPGVLTLSGVHFCSLVEKAEVWCTWELEMWFLWSSFEETNEWHWLICNENFTLELMDMIPSLAMLQSAPLGPTRWCYACLRLFCCWWTRTGGTRQVVITIRLIGQIRDIWLKASMR